MNWPILSVGREEWWTSNDGGWATFAVLIFLLGLYSGRLLFRPRQPSSLAPADSKENEIINVADGYSSIVTEADLRRIVTLLNETEVSGQRLWSPAVDKHSDTLLYNAKEREPEDGSPTQYLSTSVFGNCSTKQLLDFYMDNEYRLGWDVTFESYQQLGINKETGEEIGRIVRKFPFVRPREYVLAWRVWKAEDGSFYYCAKHCEHPQAPRSSSYTRIEHYFSGWHIRKASVTDGCEIKMVHQEDTSVMAKKAFTYRIWSYMCLMEKSLRKHSRVQQSGEMTAVTLAGKVPAGLEKQMPVAINPIPSKKSFTPYKDKKKCMRQTGKWMANGALVLGAAAFCTRGSAPIGAKIAALYAIKKLFKPSIPLPQFLPQYAAF